MEFGQIIKKAWTITWKYRFLWVLGIFAGITGAGGGGGSFTRSFNSGNTGSPGGSGTSAPFSAQTFSRFAAEAVRWLPAIFALALIWIIFALVLWALSLAARGGLIWAVDELEEGRRPTLGAAWTRGFSHIWSVLGLGLLLGLPMVVVGAAVAAAVAVPIVLAFARGGRFAAAAIVPVCGSLAIGIPLLLVMGFILGIMYVIGLRRIVLDHVGVWQSAKDAWKTFRARFKDTALMWLINWGLNVAAAIVVAIPIVIISLTLILPATYAGVAGHWGVAVVLGGVWAIIIFVVSVLYAGIWGTFTSALWTILYRRLTGREIVVHPPRYPVGPPPSVGPAVATGYPAPGYPAPGYPAPQPPAPGQPAPGAPPAPYVAPPVAGWAPPAGANAPAPESATTPAPPAPPEPPAPQPPTPHTPWEADAPPAEQPPRG